MADQDIERTVDGVRPRHFVYDPIPVRYVRHSDTGQHPEPKFDETWSDLDKLRWSAGCVEANTGVKVRIVADCFQIRGNVQSDLYGWSMLNQGGGAMPYREMWAFLLGIETGLRAER